ncbi:hypothetical protein N8819_00135 [Gammaproteobacteria bacterium]|nr:hypothetical protein [Gammaproteobacteria bacterium]MDC0006211.1 hypothetical protein [Gammaproteobacteria bacterium]
MELTRRQFIITGSALTAALAFSATFAPSNKRLKKNFIDSKDYTYEQIEQLDNYVVASILPSLISLLFLAYTFDMFSLFSSLLIISISLIFIL